MPPYLRARRNSVACTSRQWRASPVSCVTPNLFEQPSLIEPPCFDGGPSEFAHQLRQAPALARPAIALSHLQDVEDHLRADPLDAIVADATVQTLQLGTPRVCALRLRACFGRLYLAKEAGHDIPH